MWKIGKINWNRLLNRFKHSSQSEDIQKLEKSFSKNPYLQSRALWNEMYGSLQVKLENSYRIIFVLACVIVIAVMGFVIVAGQTKVKPMPFIIHGNEVLTLTEAQSAPFESVKPTLANYFVKQFIRDARSLSADGLVNAEHRIAAFSMTAGAATQVLKDYYTNNHLKDNSVNAITITSVLQESPQTVVIRWREDHRDARSGQLLQSDHYIAELTYQFGSPSDHETILQHNPLGLQITQLSWSQDQNAEAISL